MEEEEGRDEAVVRGTDLEVADEEEEAGPTIYEHNSICKLCMLTHGGKKWPKYKTSPALCQDSYGKTSNQNSLCFC